MLPPSYKTARVGALCKLTLLKIGKPLNGRDFEKNVILSSQKWYIIISQQNYFSTKLKFVEVAWPLYRGHEKNLFDLRNTGDLPW